MFKKTRTGIDVGGMRGAAAAGAYAWPRSAPAGDPNSMPIANVVAIQRTTHDGHDETPPSRRHRPLPPPARASACHWVARLVTRSSSRVARGERTAHAVQPAATECVRRRSE